MERKLSFGRLTVEMERVGNDILLLLRGGDQPHIGCTVLAVPRPSLTGDGSGSCTSSVLNVTGHKDEQLCRYLAETVAAGRQAVTVCTGGFHADAITAAQIHEVECEVHRLAQLLAADLEETGGTTREIQSNHSR